MIGTYSSIRRFLALALVLGFIPLQLPAKGKKDAAEASMRSAGLKLYILEGNDAVNFIPDRKGATPVIEVRDDNGLPVEKANVEFRLPASGASGTFEDGKLVKIVPSNISGQAEAPFNVNDKRGSLAIQVTATIDTRMARAAIFQSNSMKVVKSGDHAVKAGGRHWYKDWRILTVIGAAGTVTAVLLLTRGSSSTTVVLTPGGPTFGTPH